LIKKYPTQFYEQLNPSLAKFRWVSSVAEKEEIYEILSKKKHLVNRYPNVRELGRKDIFQNMMTIAREMAPSSFDFVPPSFIFPADKDRFEAY
jgi:hypothetical protein